jgi:hypothetical protein
MLIPRASEKREERGCCLYGEKRKRERAPRERERERERGGDNEAVLYRASDLSQFLAARYAALQPDN